MRSKAIFLLLLMAATAGCGSAEPPLDPAEYGKLPGLKATPDTKLQDELARLLEDKGTPEQLNRPPVPDQENAAVVLAGLFPPGKVSSILDESARIRPPRGFEFDPVRLQKAVEFRRRYEAQRTKARQALGRPQCDFFVDFTLGSFADTPFVEVVWICGRLEEFRAAEALAGGRPDEAADSLAALLRLAACLAAEKHPVARLEGAYLRTEGFVVLQAIVEHEKTGRKQLEVLRKTVMDELSAWPDDADAWIGDRALGLHAYELVRRGELSLLLSDKEVEQFDKEGSLLQLAEAARRCVDADELYYLQTMRQIIDSCRRPFYQRADLFTALSNELADLSNTSRDPLIARRLLLPNLRKGHAIQAQDRANWEAWALALAAAAGSPPPPMKLNPLTGEPYQIEGRETAVVVRGVAPGDADTPVFVPLPEAGQ